MISTNNKIIALILVFSFSINVFSVSIQNSDSEQNSYDAIDYYADDDYADRDRCIMDLEEMLYDFNKGILDAFLHGLLRLNNVSADDARNHYGVTYYLELFAYSKLITNNFFTGSDLFGEEDTQAKLMLMNANLWYNTPENIYMNLYFGYRSLDYIAKRYHPLVVYANLVARKTVDIVPLYGCQLYNPRDYCDRNLPIQQIQMPLI